MLERTFIFELKYDTEVCLKENRGEERIMRICVTGSY